MNAPEPLEPPAAAEWASAERFEFGAVLLRQGHQAPSAMFLASGVVKQTRVDTKGREAIVNVLGPGWILGARPILLESACVSSTVALTRCEVSLMAAGTFGRLHEAEPALSRYVKQMLAREGRDHLIARAEFAICDGSERVIRTLRRLIALFHPPVRDGAFALVLPLSQRELAQFVGMAEETVSRLLATWEEEGRVSRRKSTYVLPVRYWARSGGGVS